MFPLRAVDLNKIIDGKLINGLDNQLIEGISINTRTLNQGELFIPIEGEVYDGHDFIEKALAQGAIGFWFERRKGKVKKLVKEEKFKKDTVVIEVEDSLKAFHQLANYWRRQLKAEVVGITGSTGKTTTKDMLASILGLRLKVVWSPRNYNNEIGVPLTILLANREVDVLVVEMAMRGLGQIKELAEVALPTVGLVTNVGRGHFELLGSQESIFRAKSELVKVIPSSGTVILNEDDKWTERLKSLASGRVVTYGFSPGAEVRAADVVLDELGRPSFTIISPQGSIRLKIDYPGRHNILNSLAASAVSLQLGLSLPDIKKGLESCQLTEMRMQIFTTRDGAVVINDAYNANPDSMRAALSALQDVRIAQRRVAVLGDMLELGAITEQSHLEVGREVTKRGVDLLITVGSQGRLIAEEARRAGLNGSRIFSCESNQEASRLLKDNLRQGDVVLVKASRAMKLEEVISFLT